MITDTLAVQRELRRIGVHIHRLGPMNVAQPLSLDALLVWLRSLPKSIGQQEFTRRLQLSAEEGGPRMALERTRLPVADPDYEDPELDEEIALQAEMERVVWPTLRRQAGSDGALGLDRVPDRSSAVERLRRLPSGASYDDVMAALYTPAPE